MKQLLTLLLLIGCFSCTKDKAFNPIPPRVNETPMATTLSADSASFNFAVHDPQAKELGFLFVPSKKGRIYALGIRMPQAGQSFTVTLWDTLTRQIIKQKTIVNQINTGFNYIDLNAGTTSEEIDVQANKPYIISVNTAATAVGVSNRQWYFLTKQGSKDFLPLTKGHIQILSGRYSDIDATTPAFPDKDNFGVFGLHILFGLVDIGYYATEY